MKEKRKDKRFKEENKIIIELCDKDSSDNEKTVIALTKDISIGGTRILADKHYPVGTDVKLILTLSRSKQTINIRANVKWVKDLYDGTLFEMGIEFKHDMHDTILCFMKHLYGNEKSSAKPPL